MILHETALAKNIQLNARKILKMLQTIMSHVGITTCDMTTMEGQNEA